MKDTNQNNNKQRGLGLSILLLVLALHGIFATAFYYAIRTQEVLDRPLIISLMVLHSAANVIAAVLIWFWNKWGLYLYAASTMLAVVVGLISIGAWSVFYMILPLAILGWLLRTKWENYN